MNSTLHVRYNGESFDLPLLSLDLSNLLDDRQIKQRLADRLEIQPSRLSDYVIDRHANGNLTLRPQAIYG